MTIQKVLTSIPVLGYYDVNADVKLLVDANSKALDACLIQKDRPIAYVTRALTKTEQNYLQIEKEVTAIRFACKKFHEYGKKLVIESDHKPLETIFKKPLINAPARLQRILWEILQYSPQVIYKRGTQIPIADALSRNCIHLIGSSNNGPDEDNDSEYKVFVILPIPDSTKQRFIKLTAEDPELKLLKAVITQGWPDKVKKLLEAIRKYSNFKEEIISEDCYLRIQK